MGEHVNGLILLVEKKSGKGTEKLIKPISSGVGGRGEGIPKR